MTVSAVARRASYTGNGVTTTYAVPFQFFEIAVYVAGVLKSLGTHYTITQSSPGATGSVVFLSAPAMSAVVIIVGATTKTQITDYLDNDSFPAEIVESGFDRVTMITQENSELFGQALRAPPFAPALPTLDFVANPDSFVAVDGSGVPSLKPITGVTSPFYPSLTAAAASAAAAHTSEVNAETYKSQTLALKNDTQVIRDDAETQLNYTRAVYDAFDDRFLGAKGLPPSSDNDGSALQIGALYFDQALQMMRVWTLYGWQAITAAYGQNATEVDVGIARFATVVETLLGEATNTFTHPAGVKATVSAAIAALRNGATSGFDTLSEIEAAYNALHVVAHSGSASDLDSGTLPGARMPALSGDVVVPVNTTVTTIQPNVVTNAKLADVATQTIKGRTTAATGDPEDLTPTQARGVLQLVPIAISGSASDLSTGTVPAARFPAFTGDVTNVAGAIANTITANAVDNTKAADMAQATIKGRAVSAGTGDPTDLTPTQAKAVLAITGADVANTPAGGIAATTVQTALNELDNEKYDKTGGIVSGNMTVTGNLVVQGTTFQADSTVFTVDDVIATLGGDTAPVADDGKDRGIEYRWHNGSVDKKGFFGWDRSAQRMVFIPDVTNTAEVMSGAVGTLEANLLGNATGNASTATALQTGRTISATGDATGTSAAFDGSGNASVPLTIPANTVTNAKAAQMPANTFKGNNTGVTANAADLTTTQAKALLAIAASDVSGLATVATSGSATDLGTGTLPAARLPAMTGDVTAAVNTHSTTIAPNVVDNTKAAQMAAHTFKGNATGSTANAQDLTSTQLTAELNLATTLVKGLAPVLSGNTAEFLRGDGTYAAPPGASGGENNTASNVGTSGVGVFKQKTVFDLEFKNINAGSNKVSVANDAGNNEIDIDVVEANLTLGSIGGSIDLSGAQASGILAAARFPALTGDVTTAGGALATTIANNAVSNAKAAQMAAHTFKGNDTGSTANAKDLTIAELTAELNLATATLKGLAPAFPNNTTTFLRGDGTYAAPPNPTVLPMHSTLTSDFNGSNNTTAQSLLPSAGDSFAAAASTSYEFEGQFVVTRSAGTGSHTFAVLFGGTATLTSIGYLVEVSTNASNALAANQNIEGTSASALTITAANSSAAERIRFTYKGIVRINGAGTFIPQFTYQNISPGGAPTIKANSFFKMTPIGSDTFLSTADFT